MAQLQSSQGSDVKTRSGNLDALLDKYALSPIPSQKHGVIFKLLDRQNRPVAKFVIGNYQGKDSYVDFYLTNFSTQELVSCLEGSGFCQIGDRHYQRYIGGDVR